MSFLCLENAVLQKLQQYESLKSMNYPTASGIFPGLAFLALLQVTALVLNLIPVPPFDGFGAIEPHLSPSLRAAIEPIRGGAIWIVFIALWYVPFIGEMFWGFIFNLSEFIGIPMDLVGVGYQQFFIWK